jgi:thioesterase domain-containing protein
MHRVSAFDSVRVKEMSIVEACNESGTGGFVRDGSTGSTTIEPMAKPSQQMQNPSVKLSPRASNDEALAAVWTGILGAAKHIGNRAPLPPRQRPAVVQLRQGTAPMPVYFIGSGLYELHIAQLMPSAHSIYAVEVAWPAVWHDAAAKNDTRASPVLEDLVGPYVDALSAHARAEPCVLVGYSFHGLMAFEIAHQIEARGGKVDMIVLVDAPSDYPPAYKIAWNNLLELWRTAPGGAAAPAPRLGKSAAIACWALIEGARYVKRRFVESVLGDPGKLTTKLDTLGRPMTWQLIERLYANSIRAYRLRPLPCRGAVIRGDRPEDCPSANIDYAMGWTGLFTKGLEIVQVTGDHITMMRQYPHDVNLAREMSTLLNRSYPAAAQRAPAQAS